MTGNPLFGASLDPRRLQLLAGAVGRPTSIANLDEPMEESRKQVSQSAFSSAGLGGAARLQFFVVEKDNDLKGAFERMSHDKSMRSWSARLPSRTPQPNTSPPSSLNTGFLQSLTVVDTPKVACS